MQSIQQSVGLGGVNRKADVILAQTLLNRYAKTHSSRLVVDGVAGAATVSAIKRFQREKAGMNKPDGRIDPGGRTLGALLGGKRLRIAWGGRTSSTFNAKVIKIAAAMDMSPDYLMACMAFETGETFSPSITNAAGSGAIGLIQFMPSTAKALGTSVQALKGMSAVQQLKYVEKYFSPYQGRLQNLEDVYLAVLYPAAVGMNPSQALFRRGTLTYTQNSGFDKNKDGIITPAEISLKVRAAYEKGLTTGYMG
ncbi:peptidoglycan-binding protein [Hahella chejuensis]|nr:peptidoglycan-binding protein [Hahella chejuensis]